MVFGWKDQPLAREDPARISPDHAAVCLVDRRPVARDAPQIARLERLFGYGPKAVTLTNEVNPVPRRSRHARGFLVDVRDGVIHPASTSKVLVEATSRKLPAREVHVYRSLPAPNAV